MKNTVLLFALTLAFSGCNEISEESKQDPVQELEQDSVVQTEVLSKPEKPSEESTVRMDQLELNCDWNPMVDPNFELDDEIYAQIARLPEFKWNIQNDEFEGKAPEGSIQLITNWLGSADTTNLFTAIGYWQKAQAPIHKTPNFPIFGVTGVRCESELLLVERYLNIEEDGVDLRYEIDYYDYTKTGVEKIKNLGSIRLLNGGIIDINFEHPEDYKYLDYGETFPW